MARIRSTETGPEITVRKALFRLGFRYRKNDKRLPGKPDIVFPKYKTVVFINGCFWHGHENCRNFQMPKTNNDYWVKKMEYNRKRDEKNIADLLGMGWKVITVWECEIETNIDQVIDRIISFD